MPTKSGRRIKTIQAFLHQRRAALCFEDVPDPRKARGVRWRLPTLLSTAMWSLLLLGRSLRGAEALSEDLSSSRRLRIARRVPDSTLGDTLARPDPQALRVHLREHMMASFQPFLTSLLSAYERSDMFEAVATDSGSTSEANARFVDERQLADVMAIKGNQPSVASALSTAWPWRAHWRIENKLHGRLDIEWQVDAGRWVRRGNGLLVCAPLRVLAFNLLALLRAVHLRREGAREATWRTLRDGLRDALLHPAVRDSALEVATATP